MFSFKITLFVLSLLYYVYDIIEAASVSPTVSNSSGEYYILSNDGNSNKQIICTHSSLCYIECSDENSCYKSTINAAATSNLTLKCDGRYSCQASTISNGPQTEANIFCTADRGYACKQSTFFLNTTNIVNLECDNDLSNPPGCSALEGTCEHGGCYDLTLWSQNSDTVNVYCSHYDCQRAVFHVESVGNKAILSSYGNYGLRAADIYGANANKLDINCNNFGSCYYLEIYPPYLYEYAFSLYCVAEYRSCDYLKVYIPKSYQFTTNYMELVCPRTNRDTDTHCDILWYCQDLSTSSSSTSTEFDATYTRYTCSNTACCPWTDDNDMIKNTTNSAKIPQWILPTITNNTGEYYILSSSTSYKPIYCKNVEGCYIECNEESSCANGYIYAAKTNYLTLICSGKSSCDEIYITEGPMVEANIYCTSYLGYACSNAVFIMDETPTVNLECNNDLSNPPGCSALEGTCEHGGCYYLTLWSQNSDTVNVNCADYDCQRAVFHVESVGNKAAFTSSGNYGLRAADIYGINANELDINCDNSGACYYLDVFPPYESKWGFSLNCAASYRSCSNVVTTVPNSYTFTTNYMELICPQTQTHSGSECDVDWVCQDLGTSYQTTTTYNTPNQRFECNNAQCCPWIDFNYMSKPPTNSPTQTPTEITNSPSKSPTPAPTLQPTPTPTDQPTIPTISPTSTPTNEPTPAPTEQPTSSTASPSEMPAPSPTFAPTSPSLPPTAAPTITPTKAPSMAPTTAPTAAPTFDPYTLKLMEQQQQIDKLEETYQTVLTLLGGAFIIIVAAAFLDAKLIRRNDYFKIGQVSGIALQTLDMLSDCFFAVHLSVKYKLDKQYSLPLLISIVFIVTPATMTIIQLNVHSRKHWINSSDQVRGWLQSRSKALYVLSVLAGNSFAAVSLVNSYIFKLSFFDMGLTETELAAYTYKRVYSVVLLENMPQLVLQCWYLMTLGSFDDPITISSIAFSLISVVVSVLSMMMQRSLSRSQGQHHVKLKITGPSVTAKTKHCKTLKSKLIKELAKHIGVHHSVVEMAKPTPFHGGFEVRLNINIGDIAEKGSFIKPDYSRILQDAQNNGQLQEIFKKGWKLDHKPNIQIMASYEIQSKAERKRSEKDRTQTVDIPEQENVAGLPKLVEMTERQTTICEEEEIGEFEEEEGYNEVIEAQSPSNKGYDKVPPPPPNDPYYT